MNNEKRAGTIGLALTIFQRRLASSPEAIYQSLRRRRERLESRLRELEALQRGAAIAEAVSAYPVLDSEDVEDLEDAPDNEVELASLLSAIFATASAKDESGISIPYVTGSVEPPSPSPHQKRVIFTAHRDTLNYLHDRITTLLGRKQAIVVIHGGIRREDRRKAEESFRHDPEVQVLVG